MVHVDYIEQGYINVPNFIRGLSYMFGMDTSFYVTSFKAL